MTDEAPRAPHPRLGGAWVRVARVGQVPVYVDLILPLLLALLAWSGIGGKGPLELTVSVLAVIVFVTVHEAGHAWAARKLGRPVGGIYLHLFPVTYLDAGEPRQEIGIALAGPVANLVLGSILLGVREVASGFAPLPDPAGWLQDPLLLAVGVNFLMFGLNLLPVLPADGGRIFRALLTLPLGPRKARRIVGLVGIGVGLVLAALALSIPFSRGEPAVLWLAIPALYVAWVSARELARGS